MPDTHAPLALTFRGAELADVPALVNLIDSAYRGEDSRQGWTTEADLLEGRRTDADHAATTVTLPSSRMVVAEANGELVGCCHVERRADGTGYFGLLSVRPSLQGRGIGRILINEAERVAREVWGCELMRIQVIRQREDLIAWYQRLGYRLTGETVPFPYGDERWGIPRRPDLEFAALARSLK